MSQAEMAGGHYGRNPVLFTLETEISSRLPEVINGFGPCDVITANAEARARFKGSHDRNPALLRAQ